ncbi:MAG: hypothetical protein J7501_15115 [Bdellovibrio sp.]|nr:hypothetical protein [Bdellovibrio sp.]
MKKLLPLLFATLLCSLSQARIIQGGMDSGGGSGYAAEFISIGRGLTSQLDTLKGFPMTSSQLLDIIQKTKVEFTNDDLGNEGAKASSSLIRVSRKIWEDANDDEKIEIILHQYFLSAGLDDSDYIWTHFALDGGKTVRQFNCSNGLFGDMSISVRWIDRDGDGRGDIYANTVTTKSLFFGSNRHTCDTFLTSQGLTFSWSLVSGGIYFLLPNEALAQETSFKVKISKIDSYDALGTPIMKATGILSCKVVKP